MCRIVRTKKASADLKASAAYMRILNMATYRGSVGPWSLERLREWDKPLEALYRKIHKCLPNTPTEIIYLDPKEDSVGLGMPCLSDRCQEEKWGKIHRSLTLGGDSAVAAEGCLLRLTRLSGQPIIADHGTTLPVCKSGYLASSLTEWGDTAGRRLRFVGTDATGTPNQLISTVVRDDPHLVCS